MKYLRYLNYAAGHSGLSNGIMSIELGVVLAHLTGRRLVIDGNVSPPANLVGEAPRDPGERSCVTDLLEMPVPWSDGEATDLEDLDSVELTPHSLMDCVYLHPGALDRDSPDLRSFARGRPYLVSETQAMRDATVLAVSGGSHPDPTHRLHNLCFYSYFFYLDAATRRSVHRLLRAMRPKAPFAELAAKVAGELEPFNAVHIRRGDFKLTYGTTTLDRKPEEALAVLDANFDRRQRLVIATDERSDPFFETITRAYPNAVFIDELLRDHYAREIAELPKRDPIALAFLTQLIAAESSDFIGTMTSTFTSLIQRYRGNRRRQELFKFLWNEIPDEGVGLERGSHPPSTCVPLRNGVMVEEYAGPYSWNRYNPRINPAWQREWPESFLLPERSGAERVEMERNPEVSDARRQSQVDGQAGDPVDVELCLVGGHRFQVELGANSDLLRRLFAVLASNTRDPSREPHHPGELFQLPLDGGRAACSFPSSQLVAIVTNPPVLLDGARTLADSRS